MGFPPMISVRLAVLSGATITRNFTMPARLNRRARSGYAGATLPANFARAVVRLGLRQSDGVRTENQKGIAIQRRMREDLC